MPHLGPTAYVLVGAAVAVIVGAVLGHLLVFVAGVALLAARVVFPLGERFSVWRLTRAVRAERRRLKARPGGDRKGE